MTTMLRWAMLILLLSGFACAGKKSPTGTGGDSAEAPVPIARRVKVGSPAPPFRLLDQRGTPVSSEEITAAGGGVLIFLTSTQDAAARPAIEWTNRHRNMLQQQASVEILWITGDTVEDNATAARIHELRVALLADPRFIAASAYGLPEPDETGRSTLGLWSVFVGSDGLVHRIQRGLPAVTDVVTDAKVLPGKRQSGGFFD